MFNQIPGETFNLYVEKPLRIESLQGKANQVKQLKLKDTTVSGVLDQKPLDTKKEEKMFPMCKPSKCKPKEQKRKLFSFQSLMQTCCRN